MDGDYGPQEAAMRAYLRDGERRAGALGNRGPIRFGADGKLDAAIVESYWKHGFYVLQGVVGPQELAELRTAVIHPLELPQGRFERRVRVPAGRYGAVLRSAVNGCLLIILQKSGAARA